MSSQSYVWILIQFDSNLERKFHKWLFFKKLARVDNDCEGSTEVRYRMPAEIVSLITQLGLAGVFFWLFIQERQARIDLEKRIFEHMSDELDAARPKHAEGS